MNNLKGKTAAVTGAASGIGRATALKLASLGCHLAISDMNEDGLKETAGMAEAHGVTVSTHLLDVSDRDAIYQFAADVQDTHKNVNIIINNAGVGLTAKVADMSIEDFEWLMNINFWGVINGTQAFLPLLEESGEGHIVNISSLFGLLSMPTQSAYNASKFAVRGFTESLRMELEMYESNVSITSVHPGGIKTNIIANSKLLTKEGIFEDQDKATRILEKGFGTTADEAAEKIVNGILKNKRRVLIGRDAKLLDLAQRFFPASYQKLILSNAKKAFLSKKK